MRYPILRRQLVNMKRIVKPCKHDPCTDMTHFVTLARVGDSATGQEGRAVRDAVTSFFPSARVTAFRGRTGFYGLVLIAGLRQVAQPKGFFNLGTTPSLREMRDDSSSSSSDHTPRPCAKCAELSASLLAALRAEAATLRDGRAAAEATAARAEAEAAALRAAKAAVDDELRALRDDGRRGAP
eukprot:gene49734-19355_t